MCGGGKLREGWRQEFYFEKESRAPLVAQNEQEKWGTRSSLDVYLPTRSGFAVNFGPPPADADEEESPVAEELRGLAFEGVADELEDPAEDEEGEGEPPETVEEESGGEDGDRKQNRGNAEGVAEAVDGMLMAGRVLGDPLLAGAVA